MKYLKKFEYFAINEAQVLVSQTLVNQLVEYSTELLKKPEIISKIDTWKRYLGISNDQSDLEVSLDLQEKYNKEFIIPIKDVIYPTDMITKGAMIISEFLNHVQKNRNNLSTSVDSEVNFKQTVISILQGKNLSLENINISLIFIPFFIWENSIFPVANKNVLGVFSASIPSESNARLYATDVSLKGNRVVYNRKLSTSELIGIWTRSNKNSIYRARISVDLFNLYRYKKSGEKKGQEYLDNFLRPVRHELTHFTQFVNSLCLEFFEKSRDALSLGKVVNKTSKKLSSMDLVQILSETLIDERSFKVGLPTLDFKKVRKVVSLSENPTESETREFYLSRWEEFKTWMSDQCRIYYNEYCRNNEYKGKNKETIISELTQRIMSNSNIKLIPGENIKKKEIKRLLTKLIDGKL